MCIKLFQCTTKNQSGVHSNRSVHSWLWIILRITWPFVSQVFAGRQMNKVPNDSRFNINSKETGSTKHFKHNGVTVCHFKL